MTMRHIIFMGSPRKNGTTSKLVRYIKENVEGEVKVIFASNEAVHSCTACAYCASRKGCSIDDTMTHIYEELECADTVTFISPIYFYGVPSPLKAIIDRFQTYYEARQRNEVSPHHRKRGAMILHGGSRPFQTQFQAAELILFGALTELSISKSNVEKYMFSNTDRVDGVEDPQTQQALQHICEFLNGRTEKVIEKDTP